MSFPKIIAFNKMLKDVVESISDKFPDDKDISFTKDNIDISISMSPRTPVKMFMQGVSPFLQQIAQKDDKFFLKTANEDENLRSLDLSDKWNHYSEDEKELLWKKVQKMVLLGGKIMSETNPTSIFSSLFS